MYQALPDINKRIRKYNANHKKSLKKFSESGIELLGEAYKDCFFKVLQNSQ
ncbi:MAG: hypothetical protein HRU09_11155 [Oligoflexales bacterium]|nr:hypothetical protein [Oligoflexales bacterium]